VAWRHVALGAAPKSPARRWADKMQLLKSSAARTVYSPKQGSMIDAIRLLGDQTVLVVLDTQMSVTYRICYGLSPSVSDYKETQCYSSSHPWPSHTRTTCILGSTIL